MTNEHDQAFYAHQDRLADKLLNDMRRRRAERAGPPGSDHVNARSTLTSEGLEDTLRWLNSEGEYARKPPRQVTCNNCAHYPIDHHNSVGGAWCAICQGRCGTLKVPFTDKAIRFGHTWRRDGTCPCGVTRATADMFAGVK